MKDDLLKIISFYGVIPQLKYFQSEVFELNEAIIFYESQITSCDEIADEGYIKMMKDHIKEEIADVMVMLKQFQYFYEITDKNIEDIMKQKISRQLERIENEIKNIGLN